MSKILILLFALFALTHAVFERTDCSCTCKDGKVCVKAVPNYLEGNTQECQCKDGTCPSGLEFNGKYTSIKYLCIQLKKVTKNCKKFRIYFSSENCKKKDRKYQKIQKKTFVRIFLRENIAKKI